MGIRKRGSSAGSQIAEQLSRLNDNIERYLDSARVPKRGDANAVLSRETFIGQPLSEFEQAIKEHAELLGVTYEPER
jgi:hypothetical protein